MRGITVRFGNTLHQLITAEAKNEGVTPTAYIREAAISRMIIARARRGDFDNTEAVNTAVRAWLAQADSKR